MDEDVTRRAPVERAGIDVSVVLPVYNEVGHCRAEIERIRCSLEASSFSHEILVVDDGSTDGSDKVLRELDGINLISFPRNRGQGAALRAGMRAARGRIIVWTDVDMSYPNEEIPTLVRELEGHDQVVGARRSEEGSARFFRVPAKWLIRRLASHLARSPIPDLNSGFRAVRASVGRQFIHQLPDGFSCSTTLTMSFLMNGYSVKYIPIDYFPRSGQSKFHWRKDTQRYFTQVLRLMMSYDPLRIFVPAGSVLLAVGLAKLAYDVVAHDVRVAGNTLLILFASLQAFAIGLLADLIVRLNKPRDEADPASR